MTSFYIKRERFIAARKRYMDARQMRVGPYQGLGRNAQPSNVSDDDVRMGH
jgi:hypothetical protein